MNDLVNNARFHSYKAIEDSMLSNRRRWLVVLALVLSHLLVGAISLVSYCIISDDRECLSLLSLFIFLLSPIKRETIGILVYLWRNHGYYTAL